MDATDARGVGPPSRLMLTFGLVLEDLDNDGDPDAAAANGHVLDNVALASDVSTYRQPNQVYENRNGTFVDASDAYGPDLTARHPSRGLAAGDVDNDGDVDLFVGNVRERYRLLINEGGNRRNWLQVKLEGRWSNRDGIGARLTVAAGGRRQVRDLRSAASYQSANDLRAHFGLGETGRVDSLRVRWPSGRVDVLRDLPANRIVVVREGATGG